MEIDDSKLRTVYLMLCRLNYATTLTNILFIPYFIHRLCHAQLIHRNLRYLLAVTVLSICCPGVVRSLMDFVQYHFPSYAPIVALFADPLYSFTNGAASIAFLLIFIERFIATRRPETYEKSTLPFIKVFTMAFCFYGFVFYIAATLYDRLAPQEYPMNEMSHLHMDRRYWAPMFGWTFYFIPTFPVIPAMNRLAKYNRRMTLAPVSSNLSSRYQYNENSKALRAIVLSFVLSNILFGGISLIAFGFLFYILCSRYPLDYRVLIASKCLNISMDTGCLFFAVSLLILHPTIDRQLQALIRSTKLQPISCTKVEDEGQIYFQHLQLSWNE